MLSQIQAKEQHFSVFIEDMTKIQDWVRFQYHRIYTQTTSTQFKSQLTVDEKIGLFDRFSQQLNYPALTPQRVFPKMFSSHSKHHHPTSSTLTPPSTPASLKYAGLNQMGNYSIHLSFLPEQLRGELQKFPIFLEQISPTT